MNLNLVEPSGLVQACNGIALRLPYPFGPSRQAAPSYSHCTVTPSLTVPQTVTLQTSAFKHKFFTRKNDQQSTSIKRSPTYAAGFSARQRVTLFCSKQTRKQNLRIRFSHMSLKTCIIEIAQPRSPSGRVLVHGISTRALAAAFIVQST